MIAASGVRIDWAELPALVRGAGEQILGAPVVHACTQPGGFSPRSADRVLTRDERRAFAKAADAEPVTGEGVDAAGTYPDRVGSEGVVLLPVDEPVLVRLLATAVAEADPTEVMAPVAGPPGWNRASREAFLAYHRSRAASGFAWPVTEATFAVSVRDSVVGALRLAAVDGDRAALEVGLWLGRRHRGEGIGSAALSAAAITARRMGARRLIARTTAANSAAIAALVGKHFVVSSGPEDGVEAVLPLE